MSVFMSKKYDRDSELLSATSPMSDFLNSNNSQDSRKIKNDIANLIAEAEYSASLKKKQVGGKKKTKYNYDIDDMDLDDTEIYDLRGGAKKVEKKTSKSTSKSTSKTTSKTTGKSTSKTTGKATSKTTGKATSKTTGKATSKSTGKVGSKSKKQSRSKEQSRELPEAIKKRHVLRAFLKEHGITGGLPLSAVIEKYLDESGVDKKTNLDKAIKYAKEKILEDKKKGIFDKRLKETEKAQKEAREEKKRNKKE